MAAHIGVLTTFGLSTPGSAYTNEAESSQDVEVATVRDENGVTVIAVPRKKVTHTLSIKGKGDPGLAAVVATASVSVDTVFLISAKATENGTDFPDFEIEGKKFSNLP